MVARKVRRERAGSRPAIAAESGVQRAIGVVARQSDVKRVSRASTGPGHEDLAIRLQSQGAALIDTKQVRRDLATAAKAGIQRAVGVIARQGKV